MKKKISILFILFLTGIYFSFAQEKSLFGGDFGIATGIPVYGNTDSPYNHRAILGCDGDVSLHLGQPLKLLLGYDFLADFNWDGDQRANHLDYCTWLGIKVYPGVGGLNSSLSYALGARTDFISEYYIDENTGNKKKRSEVEKSAWGNGFRLSVEYDFHYGSSFKSLPALGFYYRMMPRGSNSYDNIFAFYANMAF